MFEGFELSARYKYFVPYFFVWRAVYACVLYNLDYSPWAQIIICCGLQMGNLGLMTKLRVYKEKMDFYLYLLYESITLVVFVLVGVFLTGISEEAKDGLSYFIIGITLFGVFAGIFVSGLEIFWKVVRKCRGQSTEGDVIVEFEGKRSGSLFVKAEKVSGEFVCDGNSNQVMPMPYVYLKQHVPSEQRSINLDESE